MNFIKDKYGQWAHPGKNTLIPNADGRITMQGVNQPVLGIDDLGNQTVMMPGGEYQFPGNSVYEIPLQEFTKHFRQGGQLPKAQNGFDTPLLNNIINPIGSLYNYGLDKVKNKIADNVNPYGYKDTFKRLYDAVFTTENKKDVEGYYKDERTERRDLLHMLMGLDQENNSILQQNQYNPTKGHNEGDTYYSSPSTEAEIKHQLSRVGKNRKENFFLDKNYQRDEEDRWTDEELEEFWISQQNQYLDSDIYYRLIYGENNDDFNNTYNGKEIKRHKIYVEEDPDKYVHFTDTPQYDNFLKSDDYDAWANNKNIERENEIDYPDAESLMTTKAGDEGMQGGFYGGVLGNFILNQGEDEQGKYFSYYDKWDLEPFKGDGDWKETLSNFGQKYILGVSPTQIYNRMYYTQDDQGNYVFKDGGSLPKAQTGNLPFGITGQGFSNIQVPGINWAEGVPELTGTEARQGVNVSGLNLSKDFNLGKNWNLNLSNPAFVYARPTLDNMPVSDGGRFTIPFEPKINLSYKFKKGGAKNSEYENMIPEIEFSILSDESYNKLSAAQKQVYDSYTNPYTEDFQQYSPYILSDNSKGYIHWKDAMDMVKGSKVDNIYNYSNYSSLPMDEDGYFRAHADPNILSGGDIYIPKIDASGAGGDQGSYYFRNSKNPLYDTSWKWEQEKYMNKLIAELGHVDSDVKTFWTNASAVPSRIYRYFKEGFKWPDSSNYETIYDAEYHTHYGPNSSERGLINNYSKQPFSMIDSEDTYGHIMDDGSINYNRKRKGGELPKAQFGRHSIMSGDAYGARPKGSTGVAGDVYDATGVTEGKWDWLLGSTNTGGASGAVVSNILDVLSVPGNLITEGVEYFGERGDKEFNFSDAMPGFSGDFSFTNMHGEPTKTVSQTTDAQGNPLVENFWGGLALDVVTDPSTWVGAGVAKNTIKSTPKIITKIANKADEVAEAVTKKVKPKTVYNVSPTNTSVDAMEVGTYGTNIDSKTQKILDNNIWATQNPIESTKYLAGDHSIQTTSVRKGLLTGEPMTLTEYQVRFPWLTGDVSTNKNILDLKKSQGVSPNTNEFLIPKNRNLINRFLYPEVKSTNLQPIPKHLMGDPMFKPDHFPLSFGSSNNFSKPYTYIGDQIRGATGHVDMPYGFNDAVNYTDHGAFMIDDGIDYNNIVNKWQDERGFNIYKRKYGGSLPQFQKKGENTYPVEVIQYPLGYDGAAYPRGLLTGHIEARYLGDLSGTEYEGQKGYVNRWVDSGNREVTYNPEEDYETGVRTSIMNLNEEEFAHYMKTAQSFTSGDKVDIPFTNLNIPTAFGGDDTDYDLFNSNCADGVCNALGLDGNYITAGVTTPQQVMDAIRKDKRTKSSTGRQNYGEAVLQALLNPLDLIIDSADESLEFYGGLVSDIFNPGTISPYVAPTKEEIEAEALQLSKNKKQQNQGRTANLARGESTNKYGSIVLNNKIIWRHPNEPKLETPTYNPNWEQGGELLKAQDGWWGFQEGGESSTIVPLQKEGKSEEIDAFGYKGYFDFSQEPINMSDDQDGHKGYLFVYTEGPTAGGSYWRPLENKYSGGRWEKSGQVEEYNAYFTNPNLIDEHWDKGSAVALKIREAVKNNVLYSELPEYLKDVNTWRTISPNRDLEKELGELDKKQDGNEVTVSFDDLEKGIRHIESLNGTLMKNKQSSASGFYGDLFDNLTYDGTRDEFIADTTFQKNHFIQRYNGEIKDVPGLESNGIDIYNEYKDQVDFTYTPTQIAALSNMLGRQGTRQYFGEVLRDGKTLEEVFPHLYGADRQLGADGKPLENKTPEQYISGFTEAISKKVGGEFNNKVKRLKQQLEKYNEGGIISPLAYQDLVKLKMIKPKMQDGGSVQQSSYVTKRGDNLSRIAANNNMSLTELLSYNPKYAANPSLVRVGETIQLSDAPVTNNATPNLNYVIKRGDNLSKIAEQYGVRYQDIQKLNNISDPRKIQPGQKIRLPDNATIDKNNKNIKEQKKQSESVYVPEVSEINVNESGNVNTPWAKRIMNNDGSWRTEGQRNIKTNINKMNQADRIIQGKNEIEGDNSKVIDYEIKRGDNLSLIAQRNGVTTEQLMTDNNISNANNIQVGKKIKIKKPAGKPYIVVDEQAGRMHLYYPGQDKPSESYPILTGQNTGDAQTVTKGSFFYNGVKLDREGLNNAMKKHNAGSIDELMEVEGYTSKIDWAKGNKQTGAGVYTIGKVNEDSGFYDDGKLNRKTPSFVLNNSNDDEVPMVIHTSPTAGSRVRNLNDNDASNNRVTNGCINGKCTDLLSLYNNPDVGEGTQVYVLPEDAGNNFVFENGEINFYASSKYLTEEGKKYIDEYGEEQVGHGIANKTTSSYKPINITFDKNYYQTNSERYDGTADGEEEEFVNNTQPFLNSLADNKKKLMDDLGMDGDTYNDLAMIAFGIYGYESGMGDEGSAGENLVKAGSKWLTNKTGIDFGNTSPDVRSKHDTYGVDDKWSSIGWTQAKWGYIEEDENAMKIMDKLGINEDNYAEWMMDPEKSAQFTIARLYDFHQKSQASINLRNKHREDGTFVKGDNYGFNPVEKYGEEKEVYDPFTYLPKQWSPTSPGYTDIVNKYTDYIDLTETDINDVDNNLIIKGEYSDNNQVSNKRVSEKSIGEKILNPLETIENEYNSSLIKPVVDMAGDVISDAADDVSEWWDEVDLNPFWKLGGEFGIRNQVQFYNDYINGLYKDTKQEKRAKQMYDKLNRIYYNDSKQNNMHQLDIMKSIENQG